MNRTLLCGAALLSAVTGSALAQGSIVYEFDLVLSENQLIDRGITSRYDDMPVGTPGFLRMEVLQQEIDFGPAFSDENHRYFSVLNFEFSSGFVSTTGATGIYPSTQHATTMHVANDSSVGPNAYHDFFGNFLAFEEADITSGLIVFNSIVTGAMPDILPDASLPTAAQLMSMDTRTMFFNTTYDQAARIRFVTTGVQRYVVPSAPTASLLALGGLVAIRRRR